MKILSFDGEARDKLLSGVKTVYDAVSSTLGPRGSVVAIDREWGSPLVVGDGVTVAKEIELKDSIENMGAKLTIEAASKTNDGAGDGTTGTVVLTYAIVSEALKNIAAGSNPAMIRRGINKAVKEVVKTLKSRATPIKSDKEIQQVATISAQDSKIGEMIATIVKKMGKDAVITIEESKTNEMTVEYRDGMQFSEGLKSAYFITNEINQEAVIDNPYVLFLSEKLGQVQDLVVFVDNFAKTAGKEVGEGKYIPAPLVVICDDIDQGPLTFFVVNKVKGGLNTMVVQAPEHGEKRRVFMEDLAILTGGTVVGGDTGITLADTTVEHLGRAEKIVSTKDNTTIMGGKGEGKVIEERVKSLQKEMANPDINDFDRDKLQERIAKLTSGIAVINVGASSETEMRERKERVIDAVSATKAAIAEGIVAGGGTALLEAMYCLNDIEATDEERLGVEIIKRAMAKPFTRLMENSGYDSGKMMGVYENKAGKNEGIDVIDGEMKNLIEAGIIDPVLVTKKMLENAASAAIMIMLTSCVIAIEKKPESKTEDI